MSTSEPGRIARLLSTSPAPAARRSVLVDRALLEEALSGLIAHSSVATIKTQARIRSAIGDPPPIPDARREEIAQAADAVMGAMRVQMGHSCPDPVTARIYATEFARAALAAHQPTLASDRLDREAVARLDKFKQAAERYMASIAALSKPSGYNGMTYFECPLLSAPENIGSRAIKLWRELNDAGQGLTAVLALFSAPAPEDGDGWPAPRPTDDQVRIVLHALNRVALDDVLSFESVKGALVQAFRLTPPADTRRDDAGGAA